MSPPVKWRKKRSSQKKSANYDQNDGVAGFVYILTNKSLKWNTLKIGCTRHSGEHRVADINKKASTGVPASYRLQYECKTVDCGLAEKRVFERLAAYRVKTEKVKQEFFRIDLSEARKVVKEECEKVDREHKQSNREQSKPPQEQSQTSGTRIMIGRYDILKKTEN